MSVPIDHEVLHIDPLSGLSLPFDIRADGTEQVHPIRLLAGSQELGVEIPGVDEMSRRQQVVALQRLVHEWSDNPVGRGR